MAIRAAGWHGAASLICVLLPLTVALFSVGVVGIQEEKPAQEQLPVEVIGQMFTGKINSLLRYPTMFNQYSPYIQYLVIILHKHALVASQLKLATR